MLSEVTPFPAALPSSGASSSPHQIRSRLILSAGPRCHQFALPLFLICNRKRTAISAYASRHSSKSICDRRPSSNTIVISRLLRAKHDRSPLLRTGLFWHRRPKSNTLGRTLMRPFTLAAQCRLMRVPCCALPLLRSAIHKLLRCPTRASHHPRTPNCSSLLLLQITEHLQ